MNELTNNTIIDVSEADFAEKVIEASIEKLIIVDFWAPWCGPCKQLTPVLENLTSKSKGKFTLAKVNIDENQQIASQLNIQSIPAVFAFKNKQIADGFQGVIPENKIIEFIEKNIGEKLIKDFTEFYKNSNILLEDKKYEDAKEYIEAHLADNSDDIIAICLLLESLIGLKSIDEASSFLESLSEKILENKEIKSYAQKLKIIKDNASGPSITTLKNDYENNPKNSEKMIILCDKLFSENLIDDAFHILFKNFNENQSIKKKKILEFFDIMGNNNLKTIEYRKKLSSIIFS